MQQHIHLSVYLTLIFSVFLSVSCTSAKKAEIVACGQRDWYETGRHDGSQGATLDRLSTYKSECGSDFESLWETMYSNARNAGLFEYCAPENSFELGRMGIAYHYVCPSTSEPEFLAGYRRGQQARDLEIQNQQLDAEIDMIVAKLTAAANTYEKRQLAGELDGLRRVRAKNERELDKIEN